MNLADEKSILCACALNTADCFLFKNTALIKRVFEADFPYYKAIDSLN